jgi:hypothetical protein
VGIKEQLAQGLLPIGSTRRQRAIDAARTVGIVGQPKPTDYERWVERVEPHLWSNLASPVESAHSLSFSIRIRCSAETQSADITSTTISLVDQSWPHWAAQIDLDGVSAEVRHAATTALVEHEPRFSLGTGGATRERFSISLNAGDTLAPRALNELVVAVNNAEQQRSTVEAILADADSCVASTRRREFPLMVPRPHLDLVEQFDVSSALFVVATASVNRAIAELVTDDTIVHVPRILLHRKRVQPPLRGLLPCNPGGDPQVGTRTYHLPPKGCTVTLVIRHPLPGEAGKRHRERVLASPGHVRILSADGVDLTARPDSAGAPGPNDFTVIVDGAAWPTEKGWLDDLVGACARDHVLAVAPLIVAPSGVSFDGGVEPVEFEPVEPAKVEPFATEKPTEQPTVTLRARSGRVDLPPYELARVTPVASLSGRVVVIRTSDLQALGVLSSRRMFDYAKQVNRSPLIWAHQRWTVEASLADISPLTPGMAAWASGRLAQWFDADVVPHQPAVWRIGEGVW